MIEMLMDYKEWIFSGIGVVFLVWFVKLNVKVILKVFIKVIVKIYSNVISFFYLESYIVNNMNIDLCLRYKFYELWLDGLFKFKFWL